MGHVKDTIYINAPVEDVDAYVGDPRNWAHFIGGMEEPRKITGERGKGAAAEYELHLMAGMHRPVTTVVSEERHEPTGCTLWAWDQKGAVPAHWTCYHQPRDGGTFATTELDYQAPWGILGKALDRLFIQRSQRRSFHNSLELLKDQVERMH